MMEVRDGHIVWEKKGGSCGGCKRANGDSNGSHKRVNSGESGGGHKWGGVYRWWQCS